LSAGINNNHKVTYYFILARVKAILPLKIIPSLKGFNPYATDSKKLLDIINVCIDM